MPGRTGSRHRQLPDGGLPFGRGQPAGERLRHQPRQRVLRVGGKGPGYRDRRDRSLTRPPGGEGEQQAVPDSRPVELVPGGLDARQVERPSTEDDLTAAGWAVAGELTAAGRKVSRDALAAALRARGHRVGTDRAAALARTVAAG